MRVRDVLVLIFAFVASCVDTADDDLRVMRFVDMPDEGGRVMRFNDSLRPNSLYTEKDVAIVWDLFYVTADFINDTVMNKDVERVIRSKQSLVIDVVLRDHLLPFKREDYITFLSKYANICLHMRTAIGDLVSGVKKERKAQKTRLQGLQAKFAHSDILLDNLEPSISEKDATKIVAAYIFQEVTAFVQKREFLVKPLYGNVVSLIQAFEDMQIPGIIKQKN